MLSSEYDGDSLFVVIPINGQEHADEHHDRIHEWCKTQNIDATFVGMWSSFDKENNHAFWRVQHPQHQTAFKLRWG